MSFALQLFDLVGIFVFALSGGVLAVRQRLDLFGVLVLACATAVTGGIVRDVLIGAIPPASLADWRYLATAMFAGVVTFFRHGSIERMRNPVLMFDAAGLALYAVLGTGKALAFGLSPFAATLLGMLVSAVIAPLAARNVAPSRFVRTLFRLVLLVVLRCDDWVAWQRDARSAGADVARAGTAGGVAGSIARGLGASLAVRRWPRGGRSRPRE